MVAMRRFLLGLIVLAILSLPIIAVLGGWIGGQHWPMQRLQVSAPFHFVPQENIRQALLPYMHEGFFAVDLQASNRALQKLHWVQRVEVRKQWPDTLIVKLQEYQPLAIWNDQQLLAEQGSVFPKPNTQLPSLPQFTGQEIHAQEMLTFYQRVQPQFRAIGLSIARVALSERDAWRIELSDGLVVDVGRNDVQQRITRFVKLLPKIQRDDMRHLVHADLRYTNGFTLVWQQKNTSEAAVKPPLLPIGPSVI